MDMNLNKQQMGVVFEEVANYFSLLCEPTRLKILHAVCNGERTVGDIVEQVESTQANVSRQINMLYRAKILARRKDGTQVYYWINDEKTLDLCKAVCGRVTEQVLGQAVPAKRGTVAPAQRKSR
jgi:DNA-binding transcriptional ArsR family regulator